VDIKYLVLVLAGIILIAGILAEGTLSGMTIGIPFKQPTKPAVVQKLEVIDNIRGFFGTSMLIYPKGDACARVINEMCDQIKYLNTAKMESRFAGEENRFLALIFEEDKKLGKLTLIKGFTEPDAVKLYFTLRDTVMSIQGWQEIMSLDIKLEGRQAEDGTVFWNKGNMTVLDFECSFGQ
jgi:hypothetical protein